MRVRAATLVLGASSALVLGLGACRPAIDVRANRSPAADHSVSPTPIVDSSRPQAANDTRSGGRNLSDDERRGGHTLARHVGRTDDDLRARLSRERQISAASTYTDRETAERVVGDTLGREARRLDSWRRRGGPRANLALDYHGARDEIIGRSLRRGAGASVPCSDAIVVLRWDERAQDFYVLTSYPEVRR